MLKLQLQKHQYLTLKSRLSARNSHSRKFESLILDLDSQFFKEYSHSHSQLSKICLRNLILNLDSQEFSPEFSFSISTLSQVTLAEVCFSLHLRAWVRLRSAKIRSKSRNLVIFVCWWKVFWDMPTCFQMFDDVFKTVRGVKNDLA